MKALVTGATGFIGSHLAEKLIKNGIQVRCNIRETSSLKWLKDLDLETVYADLRNSEGLELAVKDIDYIFHCAGVTKALTYEDYYAGNCKSTENLLNAVLKYNRNIKRFVYISSQAVAGYTKEKIFTDEQYKCQPISFYGKTKLLGEEVLLKHKNDLPFTILRPCSIYGNRDLEFYPLFKSIKYRVNVILGKEDKYVNMINVNDFIDAMLLVINNEKAIGNIYFVSDGEIYSQFDISQTAKNVYNKKALDMRLPEGLGKIVGSINDTISKITQKPVLLNSQKIQEMIGNYWLCDISKIRNDIGYSPKITLENGFKETLQWYLDNKWL